MSLKSYPHDYAPGLSKEFEHSLGAMNEAIDRLNAAKKAEIERMFPIIWERIKALEIRDYEITDNLSNIETLVTELLKK